MERINNLKSLRNRRIELRNNPTASEGILWQCLRGQKLGVKFRRQHSIGGYILDFYCIERKLVIELDGSVHDTTQAKEYDKIRDRFMADLGLTVIRFKNIEVEENIENVLRGIKAYLSGV